MEKDFLENKTERSIPKGLHKNFIKKEIQEEEM